MRRMWGFIFCFFVLLAGCGYPDGNVLKLGGKIPPQAVPVTACPDSTVYEIETWGTGGGRLEIYRFVAKNDTIVAIHRRTLKESINWE